MRTSLRFPAVALALLASTAAAAQVLTTPVVAASGLGVSSVSWNWQQVANAGGYRVIASTGGSLSGDLAASATSFALVGLSTNTAYSAYVEAFIAGVTTADAPAIPIHTLSATPVGSALLGTAGNTVSLSWGDAGNPVPTTFEVQWLVAGSTPVVLSTQSVSVGSVSATVSDLPGGQTVGIAVRSRNGDGVASGFEVVLTTAIPAIAGQPTISSGTYALGISSIAWYWSVSTGALNYQVYNATGGAVSPMLPPTQFSYIQTGLLANTSYTNYVEAFGPVLSTTTAPFRRFTLAAPTTGLAVLNLSTAAVATLAWGANGNPPQTNYDVLWWTAATSTITISTAGTTAVVGGLYAGGTDYFTVRARNGEGIPADFDATFYGIQPSTSFPVGAINVPAGFSGTLIFTVPNKASVAVQLASGTFTMPVALSVAVSSAAPPSLPGSLTLTPVLLQLNALDAGGMLQEPTRPFFITIAYLPGALGAVAPETAALARYDSIDGWVTLVTTRDPMHHSVTGVADHLSLFALVGVAPPGDLSSITVGPNPLRPTMNPGQWMTFRNLPAGAHFRVFTLLGEKLSDTHADGAGLVGWDGRNRAGNPVASGVYLVLIESNGTRKTMRVAIER